MAVYQMSKPKPQPVQYGGPQPAKPGGAFSEMSKPGYGDYTRPSQPAKPQPGGPAAQLTAQNGTGMASAPAPAQPFQPLQYQNTTGQPLSFQEQMRQQLNAMGAQLPAPQPQQNDRINAMRGGAAGVGNANPMGAQKPPMQDYSKPAQQYGNPAVMPPAQAGAETGYTGQANFGPPQQTQPIVGNGSGYGGFTGGGGYGGAGGSLASALSDYLGNYRGMQQTLPYVRNQFG